MRYSTEIPEAAQAQLDEVFERAERHMRASRGRLRRAAETPDELAMRVGCSVAHRLESELGEVLDADQRYASWFHDTEMCLFTPGLDQLRLMLALGLHINNRCIELAKSVLPSEKVEALLELHAHSLLVAGETLDLLRIGWPAAAEARWRTLHEIEVVALFLAQSPNSVSIRYRDSWDTDLLRHLDRGEVTFPGEPGRQLTAQVRKRANAAIKRHGPEMRFAYGWAAKWLRKKRVSFKDLEARVNPRRPAYVSASIRLHSGRVGAIYSMLDGPGRLLTGRRPDGIAHVGLQTLWSANTAAGALLATLGSAFEDGKLLIWDEAQTEIANEADLQLRRAEMTRLHRLDRHDEMRQWQVPPQRGLANFAREASSPRRL